MSHDTVRGTQRDVGLLARVRRIVFPPEPTRRLWVTVGSLAVVFGLFAPSLGTALLAGGIPPDFLRGYHPGAVSLARGSGYENADGFITQWPPGYSLFLAPWVVPDVGASLTRLLVLGGILSALWIVLLALLARTVVPTLSTAVFLSCTALWPPLLPVASHASTEQLFAVLVTAAVLAFARLARRPGPPPPASAGWGAGLGLLLGAATLVRTMGFAVSVAVLAAFLAGFRSWPARARLAAALAGLVAYALVLTPWVMVFERETGRLGFTTAGVEIVQKGFAHLPDSLASVELKRRAPSWRSNGDILNDLLDVASEHPAGVARLLAAKSLRPWYVSDSGRFDRWLLIVQLPWCLLFSLASVRALRRFRELPAAIVAAHAVAGACWILGIWVMSLFRYLAPVFPLAVLAVFWHLADAGRVLLDGADRKN